MTPGPKPHPVPQASVTDSPAIHVQSEEPAEPFWRAITVVGLFFLAVTIAAAIGGPVLLMLMFWSPWLLFLLVIVALGAWLLVKTVAAVRGILWRARHRSSFILRDAGIETTEWNTVGADSPVRRSIPIGAVTSVVVSYRILRRILSDSGGAALTETAPILHVLFDQGGRRQIASIPFVSHRDPGVDTWIEELRQRGVELRYTARLLTWKEEKYLSDEARLGYFAATEEVIPFPAEGGWLENSTRLERHWHQHVKQLQERAERRDPSLREARMEPSVLDWIIGAWLAGMYTLGTSYVLMHLVNEGTLSTGSWPLGVVVVLPGAVLFFLPLRRCLRWYHLLVCWLLLLVTTFAGAVMSVEALPGAEGVAAALLGMTVVSPALLWIPYLLLKRTASRCHQ